MRFFAMPSLPTPLRVFLVALAGASLMAVFMASALAQAPTDPAPGLVDVSPLVDLGLSYVNAVLVPIFGWIATMLFQKVRLDKKKVALDQSVADEAMNRMLHAGIQRGVDWLEGHARDWLFADGKPVAIDVGSRAVKVVADRMIEFSPELLKRMGVDETTLQRLAAEALSARTAQTALLVEGLAAEPSRLPGSPR